jgi:hypothetical protein
MKKITLSFLTLSVFIFSCSKSENSSTGNFLIVQSASCFTGSLRIINMENDNLVAIFEDAAGNTVDFTPKPNTWYNGYSGSPIRFNFGPNPRRIDATMSVGYIMLTEGYTDPCK